MSIRQLRSDRFPIGRVLATPGVLLALEKAGQQSKEFLTGTLAAIGVRSILTTPKRTRSVSDAGFGS